MSIGLHEVQLERTNLVHCQMLEHAFICMYIFQPVEVYQQLLQVCILRFKILNSTGSHTRSTCLKGLFVISGIRKCTFSI